MVFKFESARIRGLRVRQRSHAGSAIILGRRPIADSVCRVVVAVGRAREPEPPDQCAVLIYGPVIPAPLQLDRAAAYDRLRLVNCRCLHQMSGAHSQQCFRGLHAE